MNLQATQFVKRAAANMATGIRQDPRTRDKLTAVPDEALHAKSANTVVGGILMLIGCLVLFGSLGGIGAALKFKWVATTILTLSFLFAVPALGVVFIILGAVNISNELKNTLGWFSLFVRGFVAIFRKQPADPPAMP